MGESSLDVRRRRLRCRQHRTPSGVRCAGGFIDAYASGKLIDIFADHPIEEDAGLSDEGYGRLRIWTGSQCVGVTRLGLHFSPPDTQLVLEALDEEEVDVD